jgi:hypothetical protein
MQIRWIAAATAALAMVACREADGPLNPGIRAGAYVVSDPPGARILIDNRETGRLTPDTIRGLTGRHDISVQLDTMDTTYGFTARISLAAADSVITIAGPLVMRCAEAACFLDQFRYWSANRVRFASNPVGNFFLRAGTGGDGLLWPSLSNNSYASAGMPAFAGIESGRDTVALGIYDNGYLAGRPAPTIAQTPDRIDIRQATWIVPPSGTIQRATVRGIQISERVTATREVDDVVVIQLVFRNITNQALYAALDPAVPVGGLTFNQAYIGFMIDPDIGVANDDALSYDLDLDLAFAYDVRFEENVFGGGYGRAPGLIGLRMLAAPPGTTIILNGWTTSGGSQDWRAGLANERNGWTMLSGTRPFGPDHPHPRLGHLPPGPGDVRLSVTAGPVRLAPGDSAAVTLAVVLADPVPGTFISGNVMDPGDPTDRTRVLYSTAANLRERAIAASTVR